MSSADLPGGLGTDLQLIGSQPLFPPGTLVGDYELLERIGRGGFGEVYRAKNTRFDRVAALKFVSRVGAGGSTPVAAGETAQGTDARALDEVEAAVALNLDAFIHVHGLWNAGVIYPPGSHEPRGPTVTVIEMEYAGGRNLAEWRGRAGLKQVVGWLVPVARAIHDAHQLRGLTHYDLKPQNILLVDVQPGTRWEALDPAVLRPRVGDFGLAGLTGSGRTPEGTTGFAPPEQRNPNLDSLRDDPRRRAAAIDGFALAATVVAMFDPDWLKEDSPRTEPYSAADLGHLAAAGADRDLLAVLRKQLDPDPTRRYETVGAFADDLQRWLAGEAVAARNYRWAVWKAFKKQPRWVRYGIPLLLAALVVAGVAFALERIDKSEQKAAVARAETDAERAKTDAQRAETDKFAAEAEAQKAKTAEFAANALAQQIRADFLAVRAEQAHDGTVTAARTAARRGGWKAAMELYDKAIHESEQDRRPDSQRLRVERLFGYFVLGDLATIDDQLRELEATDLGDLAAPVRLARGMHHLCEGRPEAGRESLRAALADRDKLFSPADVTYAEALLETRPTPVIEKLRKVVEKDALHYPAQMALAVTLLLDGNLKAARDQCALVEGLFPDATAPLAVRGVLDAFDGNRDAMRRALTAYAAKAGNDTTVLKGFCEAFANGLDVMAEFDSPLAGLPKNVPEKTRIKSAMMSVWALRGGGGPLAFAEPAIAFHEWIKDTAVLAGQASVTFGDDGAFAKLEQKCRESGEAIYRAAAFYNRLTAFAFKHQKGTFTAGRPVLAQAAEYAHAAADADTIMPRSPLRYVMRSSGLMADVLILRFTPDPDPVHFRRLREHIHELVAKGDAWPDAREYAVFQVVGSVFDDGAPAEFVADWKLDTAEGRRAYWERNRELYHLARTVLDAWAVTDDHKVERRKSNLAKWSAQLEAWADKTGVKGAAPAVPPRLVAPAPREK